MRVKRQIRAAMKGDMEALISLIMEQKKDYYGLAYSFLRNEHDAMDACEEMIIIVYEQIQHLKKEDSFYSWSKTILVNICKRMLIKSSREIVTLNEQEGSSHAAQSAAEAHDPSLAAVEMKLDIEEAVKRLPKETQDIIKLKYWYDLELQHIATVMGMPLGTIKSRLHYAKKQLVRLVGRREDHE